MGVPPTETAIAILDVGGSQVVEERATHRSSPASELVSFQRNEGTMTSTANVTPAD